MDIKPFVMPELNIWTDLGPEWIIWLVISSLFLLAGFSFSVITKKPIWVLMCAVSVFGLLSTVAICMESSRAAYFAAYDSHVSELKDSLKSDGFRIVSGTPSLKANTQSNMLLSYEGKNFDCTLFSPEDIETSIVFSCGEAKLSLNEIKETK